MNVYTLGWLDRLTSIGKGMEHFQYIAHVYLYWIVPRVITIYAWITPWTWKYNIGLSMDVCIIQMFLGESSCKYIYTHMNAYNVAYMMI